MSVPDKEVWKKHKVRILGKGYDNYEIANKACKRAEDTSNLDSGSDEEKRPKKKPKRYESDSEYGADESAGEDSTPVTPKKASSALFPSPPSDQPFIRKQSTPVPTVIAEVPSRADTSRNCLTGQVLRRSPRKHVSTPPARTEFTRNTCTLDTPRSQLSFDITEDESFGLNDRDSFKLLMSKIDVMQKDIKLIKSAICDEEETIQNFLTAPLDSVEDVNEFEDSLDEVKRKKLVNCLAGLQGGTDAGKICRKIMRTCMTNGCMSHYSGTGQKGKLRFVDTKLFQVIISAGRKASRKNLSIEDLKNEVFDTLRVAPNKPGGINYVKKNQNKRKRTLPEIPEED